MGELTLKEIDEFERQLSCMGSGYAVALQICAAARAHIAGEQEENLELAEAAQDWLKRQPPTASPRDEELIAELMASSLVYGPTILQQRAAERLRSLADEKAELQRDVKIAFGNTNAAIDDYNDALARIAELEIQMKSEAEGMVTNMRNIMRAADKEETQLRARIASLEEALTRFGKHTPPCEGYKCICGFSRALHPDTEDKAK
jgi:DNA repair exonuclease SbcCD ATPase subunit